MEIYVTRPRKDHSARKYAAVLLSGVLLLVAVMASISPASTQLSDNDAFDNPPDRILNDHFGQYHHHHDPPTDHEEYHPFASLHPKKKRHIESIEDVYSEIQAAKLSPDILHHLAAARRAASDAEGDLNTASMYLRQPPPPIKPDTSDPDAPPLYDEGKDPTQDREFD